MQQGINKGDVLQRLAGLSFIVGAVLLVVFNVLLPRASDPSNTQAALIKLGENETMAQVSALLLAVGIWALMIGMAGVYRSISSGAAAVWARLGFYGIIVGTTLFTVTFALLMAQAGAAADALPALKANDPAGYSVAATLHAADLALFNMTVIVEWLALTFVGVGMVMSNVYAKWLGWPILVLGVLTIVLVGIPQSFTGPSTTLQLIFMILSLLSTVWALVVGIWIARRAW